MNELNYSINQEFSKVFGRDLVEYDEPQSPDKNNITKTGHSSLEQVVKNAEQRQLQIELSENKAKAKKAIRQTMWKPLLQIALYTLALILLFNGISGVIIPTIYMLGILLTFFVSKKDKEASRLQESIAKLRVELIEESFSNDATVKVTSPFYNKQKGKVAVTQNGITKTYKYKMAIDSKTGFETVDIRRVF